MIAANFAESHRVLGPPSTMTSEECDLLPVYCDGETCLSCWDMTFRERLSALFFGKVWLWVHSGKTQPPVAMTAARTVFVETDAALIVRQAER